MKQIVSYTYDSWGKVISVKNANGNEITDKNHIGLANPYRYRSYRYDTETGVYYLNSRYYNPVNNVDYDGNFAIPLILGVEKVIEFGMAVLATYATVATASVAENFIDKIKEKSKAKVDEKTEIIPKTQSKPKDIIIYRYGGTNPGNLTPKVKDIYSGLSFSTIPRPGSAMTIINQINSTGVVYAVQDGPFHVSVRPIGVSMEVWIDKGANSIWTNAIKSVVIKF